MKIICSISVFILLFLFSGSQQEATAQNRFVDHSTQDGISIQYRWVNSSRNRNSPLELRLKIKNNNSYPVTVSYDIEFYMGPIMEEKSETTEMCINPKLARTGRLNGMYYQSSKLSNDQLESEDFTWEFSDMKVERVESCRR